MAAAGEAAMGDDATKGGLAKAVVEGDTAAVSATTSAAIRTMCSLLNENAPCAPSRKNAPCARPARRPAPYLPMCSVLPGNGPRWILALMALPRLICKAPVVPKATTLRFLLGVGMLL